MSEPVTIGDQTFIKTADGWIDKKTKAPADKGLMKLLNSLSTGEATKKLRVRIDRSIEPVSIAGSKYVFDSNQHAWIDEKSRMVAPESLQKTLNSVVGIKKAEEAPTITQAMGEIGVAAAKQVKTPTAPKTGGGTIPQRVNVKINSPIVAMIEKLATIDGYLKQRLQNQKAVSDKNVALIREQAIEQKDAEPVKLSEGTREEKKTSPASIIAAVGLAGLIAAQFDPVKEAFSSVVEFSKSIYGFLGKFVDVMNNGLKSLLSLSDSVEVPENAVKSVPKPGGGTQIQAESGYGISAPAESGSRYVYKEGSDVGYRIEQDAKTGRVSINKDVTAKITYPSTSKSQGGSSSSGAPVSIPPAPRSAGAPSSPPAMATPVDNKTATPTSPPASTQPKQEKKDAEQATGAIPKNDIVALGNYLVGQGAERNKLEHPAFGSVGEHSKNSRHYRGMAIDVNFPGPQEAAILDKLEPQLRAAGYNTIWRKPGHYTHMHVSVGGPEGSGGDYESPSLLESATGVVTDGMKAFGGVVKKIGKEVVGPRNYVPMEVQTRDAARAIQDAHIQKSTAIAEKKSPPVSSTPSPALPNINAGKEGAPVRNPPTQADRSGTLHYLQRQGLAVA